MHRKPSSRISWFLLLLVALGGCERREHLVEQHLLAFGTIVQITLITDDLTRAEHLLKQIEFQLNEFHHQWHAWEDSDLTRFNQSLLTGQPVTIPASLKPLLQLSQQFHQQSDGMFNPALGKLIAAYGFHGQLPDSELIEIIRDDLPRMTDLIIEGNKAQSLNPHLQIDLGGIAKGYAIGWISDFLSSHDIENHIVNAGGDLAVSGNRFGKPWHIGIQNPGAPGAIAGLKLEGKYNLFTSGNYRRQHWLGKQHLHHIIDPATGDSSRGQQSATVLMQDPVAADVAATVMMINGARQYEFISNDLQIDDFLLVNDLNEIIISHTMAKKVEFSTNMKVKIVN
ncbi:MAG: FAD:protein FMN transferase [Pseudomonadota bacterium]